MTKWIVGLLLLANLALFAWMRWGAALTVDANAVQPALNAEKVRLLDMQPAVSSPAAAALVTKTAVSMPASEPSAVAVLAVSAPVAATPVAPPKEAGCAEWGEFSGTDLARAQQALSELKLGDRLTQRNVEHSHGYWVYIPPLRNHAEVERKIAQLKERGVKDYFVAQEEGKWSHAISLGVFKTEEAAQRHLVSLRAKGVRSAKVGERMSKLKFVVFVLKGLDAGSMAKVEALQKGFPGSELTVSACSN